MATIPVTNGSQFKFIVNNQYIVSNEHIEYIEAGNSNNLVQFFTHIFDNELQNRNRTPLLNSLSQGNISVINALELNNSDQKCSSDFKSKSKICNKDDEFFGTIANQTHWNSPPINIQPIDDLMVSGSLCDSGEDDSVAMANKHLVRPRSEFFIKDIDKLDSDKISDNDSPRSYEKQLTIISGAHHIGKDGETYEDAYFMHKKGVGVSDGVSSWCAFNISTDMFSRGLMDNAKNSIANVIEELGLNVNPQLGDGSDSSISNKIDPARVMNLAFQKVIDPGSATC